jgi:hypothetical protein
MLRAACFALIASLASAAHAEIQQGMQPVAGTASTVTVGDVMLKEYRVVGGPRIVLRGSISARWGSLEQVDLPAGTALAVIRQKHLKACQTRTNLGWENCVIDANNDGAIDRVSFNDVGGAKDVNPPVPYELAPVQVSPNPRLGEGDDFKKELVFTGATADTITISYREYVNDLARPAFTEQLTVPLSKSFPQEIAVKGHVFSLSSLDGMGLHYTVEK